MNGHMLPLVDGFGREAHDLRLSVTDVCNLRCTYCMPAEGLQWLTRQDRLDDDETVRIVQVLARLGVRTIRITGGEPLARQGLPALISRLAQIPGIVELSMTTNGVMLERCADELVDSGVTRFNISIDSVDPHRFAELTRRDQLPAVLRGIAALDRHRPAVTVKLNAVSLRGVTEREAVGLAHFARERSLQLRFIEVMPLDAEGNWTKEQVLTGEAVRRILHEVFPLEPTPREAHATATVFKFADGNGEVGFVSSVSEPFCGDCDRLRVTADGQLRTCLFSHQETDLRTALRTGASDLELSELVRSAVAGKQWGHEMSRPGFKPPDRPMSAIGG